MHFVYHPHHAAIIVSPEEYQHYLCNGWYDTPAKFPANLSAQEAPSKALESAPQDEAKDVTQPKKKGRPPRVKPEEVQASTEL